MKKGKRKRILTEDEIEQVREIMENAPQGRKPSVRFFARLFNVNQPSVVKSLGGWEGIQRGKPVPPPKFKPRYIDMDTTTKIDTYTQKVDL